MVASLLNVRHDLVPHVNRGDRRMKIAMLNSMAGEKAVSCGAFQSALSYFKTAVSLLPEDHWESQFEDSLNLYSSVAECSFVTFNMEDVNTYATQVINQD
jgi:predicted ATPase